MTTLGLLARIDAAPGHEDELEALITGARAVVDEEGGTIAWFGIRFGRGEYGVFDAFDDEAGRDAHLGGGVVAALGANAHLLDGAPQIEKVEVVADKRTAGTVTKGLLVRLPIKPEHAADAEGFLHAGQGIVDGEPATTAWFGIRFENGDIGVFDVFGDKSGRGAHLTGEVPKAIAANALGWLSGLPLMQFPDVLAQKL